MKRTVSRLFDSHDEAAAAIADLETAGFAHDDINLMSPGSSDPAEDRSFASDGHHNDNIHATHGGAKGAVNLKLGFVSSRTVIFRYTNASGQKSEVKIKVRVTKKKK